MLLRFYNSLRTNKLFKSSVFRFIHYGIAV